MFGLIIQNQRLHFFLLKDTNKKKHLEAPFLNNNFQTPKNYDFLCCHLRSKSNHLTTRKPGRRKLGFFVVGFLLLHTVMVGSNVVTPGVFSLIYSAKWNNNGLESRSFRRKKKAGDFCWAGKIGKEDLAFIGGWKTWSYCTIHWSRKPCFFPNGKTTSSSGIHRRNVFFLRRNVDVGGNLWLFMPSRSEVNPKTPQFASDVGAAEINSPNHDLSKQKTTRFKYNILQMYIHIYAYTHVHYIYIPYIRTVTSHELDPCQSTDQRDILEPPNWISFHQFYYEKFSFFVGDFKITIMAVQSPFF